MANTFKRKEYGSWEVFKNSYSRAELEQRRRRLAKVANSRILGLERAVDSITGQSPLENQWFSVTLEYLSAQGRRRFSEASGRHLSDFRLKREIVVLENFLKMKTSTIGGYRAVQNKRIQNMLDKGVPMDIATNPEFYDFLNSETFRHLEETTEDSETLVEIFSREEVSVLSLDEILKTFRAHEKSSGETYEDLIDRFQAVRLKKETRKEY